MSATESPRVLVIDSHPIMRGGLVSLLSPALRCGAIAEAGDFSDALRLVGKTPIDLVVSEFRIHGETVLSFLDTLKKDSHRARCLIFTGQDEIQAGYPCMHAGAAGFVSKAAPGAQMVEAVNMVLAGRLYVSGKLANVLLMGKNGATGKGAVGALLSRRELEVFAMIATLSVSQVAVRLGVSVKTVEAHRENIKNKLGCGNASQLIATAVRWLDETTVAI